MTEPTPNICSHLGLASDRTLTRTAPDGWHPAEVDLSEFAGKTLLLSLTVDSDGPFTCDWATWAEPSIR